ncbi:MAG: hypothetical protein AAF211_02585 [Myxococcota bacterium]
MLLLALLPEILGVAMASDDAAPPNVVLHAGRSTKVFDAETVHVAVEEGAHRVTTPAGFLDLPVTADDALAVAGQTWLLNDHVWVEVVSADDTLIEFAIVD